MGNEHFRHGLSPDRRFLRHRVLGDSELALRGRIFLHRGCNDVVEILRRRHTCFPCRLDRLLNDIGAPDGAGGEKGKDNDSGTCQNKPIGNPDAAGSGYFIEAGADARQKRGGHFGVGGGMKAGIDGSEESLLLIECGAAGGAGIEVRAQITVRVGTFGCGFD
jgi:hypothetical protein